MREVLLILFVTMCTVVSQLLVKYGVGRLPVKDPGSNLLGWLVSVATSPGIIGAVSIQAFGFLVWIVVVSRVKLGAAFAISGGFFYLLVALSSWLLYGERLSPIQWFGLVVISVGVLLVIPHSP